MLDPSHPLAELLRRDQRFHFDAYVFVFDALRYAQEQLRMGQPADADEQDELTDELLDGSDHDGPGADGSGLDGSDLDGAFDEDEPVERHVTGQELCEAMRRFALEQYGMLAKNVLNHWGVRSTSDFGEIVFNLIDIGQMRKTDDDRREDFDEVFSFDALVDEEVFSLVDTSGEG